MSKKTLAQKAQEYKIRTGYADSTPEERELIAKDLLKSMAGLRNYENESLISNLNKLRWGCMNE